MIWDSGVSTPVLQDYICFKVIMPIFSSNIIFLPSLSRAGQEGCKLPPEMEDLACFGFYDRVNIDLLLPEKY